MAAPMKEKSEKDETFPNKLKDTTKISTVSSPDKRNDCQTANMNNSIIETMDGSFLDVSIKKEEEELQDSFFCGICQRKYRTKDNLNRHLKIHTSKFQCKSCTLFFDTEEKLTSHKDAKHQPHLCVSCGKSFSNKANLDRHASVHGDVYSDSNVMKCPHDNCNKKFLLKSNYESHVNVHSGLKPYDCSHCGHMFSNKYKRNEHEKICSGLVSITCSICQMRFTRKDQLKRHQTAQHTDKRFCCACGKTFSYLSALNRHGKKCRSVEEAEI